MVSNPKVAEARDGLQKVLAFDRGALESRPEWGTINFEDAHEDFDRIFSICTYLSELPIERLTEQIISSISQQLGQVTSVFGSIDEYSIESDNPTQRRNNLLNQVHQRAEELSSVASPWIPYLAYERGDVDENIRLLQAAVENAENLVTEGQERIAAKEEQIDKAVIAAREASAAAGAAVFTKDFEKEATNLGERANNWLWITAGLAIATAAAAFVLLVLPPDAETVGDAIHSTALRLTFLGVLAGGTVWTGRIFRALAHQEAVNQHRALGLKTFQAFSSAASDDLTRDAVLLETTRAIFGPSASGYLDPESEGPANLQVVELVRRMLGREE